MSPQTKHTFKVICLSWPVVYAFCFRHLDIGRGGNGTDWSTKSAQLKSDGVFINFSKPAHAQHRWYFGRPIGLQVADPIPKKTETESAHLPAVAATNTAAEEDADVTSPKRRAYLQHLVPSLIDRALDDAQPFGTTSLLQTFGTNTSSPKDPTQAYAACVGPRTPAMIIISLVANLPEEYVSLLRANRLMVAEPFNYMYCDISHSLDTDRDVAWSKVIAVRHLLSKQSQPVVWMDADAIFMTNKLAFEEFTDAKFKTKDILFTEDTKDHGQPINSGVFVTKSTAWTRSFWNVIYNDFYQGDSPFWEQAAIVEYLYKYPDDMSAHTAIEPCCVMNNVGYWSGEFIAHPAGGHKKPHKYQKLTSILKEMHV